MTDFECAHTRQAVYALSESDRTFMAKALTDPGRILLDACNENPKYGGLLKGLALDLVALNTAEKVALEQRFEPLARAAGGETVTERFAGIIEHGEVDDPDLGGEG